LSKGHAALALYAALFLRGLIVREQLETYCGDGTLLGVHPEHALPGVDFCTGSLGMGLSFGVGSALAARMKREERRVFVLISDAECNEGSTWESAMFASHHRLGNVHAILDLNGQQALGHTQDVLDLKDMAARWRTFGWEVQEVDGHDSAALARAFGPSAFGDQAPRMTIARTVFGKGVSFMENQVKWHYLPMSETEYQQALREAGAAA
jgi:transketolase